jgi:hypothetical protein
MNQKVIGDQASERCLLPSETHKDPCPHAIEHEENLHCRGGRCERTAKLENELFYNLIYCKCVSSESAAHNPDQASKEVTRP